MTGINPPPDDELLAAAVARALADEDEDWRAARAASVLRLAAIEDGLLDLLVTPPPTVTDRAALDRDARARRRAIRLLGRMRRRET
jgi:hypothetical protein